MKHNRSKSKNPRAVRVEQAKAREANARCHLESTRTELKLARKRIGELESEAQGLREKALEKGSSKKLGKDVFLGTCQEFRVLRSVKRSQLMAAVNRSPNRMAN